MLLDPGGVDVVVEQRRAGDRRRVRRLARRNHRRALAAVHSRSSPADSQNSTQRSLFWWRWPPTVAAHRLHSTHWCVRRERAGLWPILNMLDMPDMLDMLDMLGILPASWGLPAPARSSSLKGKSSVRTSVDRPGRLEPSAPSPSHPEPCRQACVLAPCQLHHRGCAAVAAPSPLRPGYPGLKYALHLGGITLQRWIQHTACSTNEDGCAAPSSLPLPATACQCLPVPARCSVLASRDFIHRPRRRAETPRNVSC